MDLFFENTMLQGVKQLMHAFAKGQIRPAARAHDEDESMPWEIMKRAATMGLTQTAALDANRLDPASAGAPASASATTVPGDGPADGGQGAGKPASKPAGKRAGVAARMACVACEELAWGCPGIMLAIFGSGLAAAPVAQQGTDEQKQVFRDALAGTDDQGRIKIAAMALSEPSTGSDISSLSTTARRDGSHWVINGHKQWITNGRSASLYVVWAQTDPSLGRAGVRGFLVTRDTPGLVPGRKETKLGIRASETAQVHFEDCRVHGDMMLGIGGQDPAGLRDTKKMLDATRPMVGAQAVGIARAAFEHLRDRVRDGTIRGTPMAAHQHIAFALAEMEMEIEASRMLVHRAAWMADHRVDNVSAASMAKAHAARTAQVVTTRAMALLGEEALAPGHLVEKLYRDAKIYDIFEGTGQIQRRIIAKQITGVNAT